MRVRSPYPVVQSNTTLKINTVKLQKRSKLLPKSYKKNIDPHANAPVTPWLPHLNFPQAETPPRNNKETMIRPGRPLELPRRPKGENWQVIKPNSRRPDFLYKNQKFQTSLIEFAQPMNIAITSLKISSSTIHIYFWGMPQNGGKPNHNTF